MYSHLKQVSERGRGHRCVYSHLKQVSERGERAQVCVFLSGRKAESSVFNPALTGRGDCLEFPHRFFFSVMSVKPMALTDTKCSVG